MMARLSLKPIHVVPVFSLLLLISWLAWSFRNPRYEKLNPNHSAGGNDPPIEYTAEELELFAALAQYGITDIKPGTACRYTKIDFEAVRDHSFEAPLLQDIGIALPKLSNLRTADTIDAPAQRHASAKVPIVPWAPSVDASNIVFGVATDLNRLDDSLQAFSHWAIVSGVRIIAVIADGPTTDEVTRVARRAEQMSINLQIILSKLEFNDRYFSLTKVLYEHRGNAHWAAFIDDDTFFPSMIKLQDLLLKYDARQSHCIGALTEDLFQISLWGLIAYGGAGIFVSMPLLEEMMIHYDPCMATTPSTGDKRLAMCILTYTTTRISYEPQLHQVDLKGDATGFYEALRSQPISIHHWKSWNHINISSASLVSKICGDSCMFQKYRLSDDWQLTNGVSLVRYNHVRDGKDIRMEFTWQNSRGQDQEEMFRHSLAPLKPKDLGKIQYLLEGAQYNEQAGQVRQFYVRRLPAEKKMDIVEVVWRKASPVMEDGSGKN